ncbi:MAG: hypothetical protein DRJ07_17900 [Bacteroidetes bacterium]|nr:MAG: hypothetical protein DRJ07_17900 [Bacteroidota bacterium]
MNKYNRSVKHFIMTIVLLWFMLSINAQSFTIDPYLANPVNHSITIRWESSSKANFLVKYGNTESFGKSKPANFIAEKESRYLYEVNIDKLLKGRKYFYKVSSEDISSKLSSFKVGTKNSNTLSFVVLGDSRSKPHIFKAIADQINKIDPAVIIANGDLVAKGGSYKNWQSQFFTPIKDITNHIPFITAVGDHESDNVDGDEATLFTHFLFPHKDNLKLWFSYDFNDAHFVFLDWRYPDSKEMIEWFKKDMHNSDKKWKFVVMHRPSYNLGGHRVAWGRNVWPELFMNHKIDIVFSGHSHLYERFYPIRPLSQADSWAVTYITTGGAGASLYEAIQHSSLAYTESINHFLKVQLKNNQIELKALDVNGKVLDSISWSKNKGIVSPEYLATVTAQEELDIINVFNAEISKRMERLPMVEIPYEPVLKLSSLKINEDIEFTIRLAKESEGKYEMQPVSGILKANTKLDIPLKIFGKSTLTVSKWGDLSPVLRLIAEYETKTFKGNVTGKVLEYIAW